MGLILLCVWFWPVKARGQIDPVARDLIQVGYNAAFEGHAPLAAYAFYYRNQPNFLGTNLALRMAIAPTYLDSELALRGALGSKTDLAFGLAGGGFADSHYEVRQGLYRPAESFDGHGAEVSTSLYHLFNPGQRIPLYGILKGAARYSTYVETDDTASGFEVPDDLGTFSLRTGFRWGGREPILFPSLAMELSAWYVGEFRTHGESFGYNQEREIEHQSHFFFGEAFLAYTLPWKHRFYVSVTAGTSIDADRLNAYRLGGFLPFVAEYPLSLPGYYYQELSATRFILFGGSYIVPLDKRQRWNLSGTVATAGVDYLPGFEQPSRSQTGVGAGIFYTSPAWRVMLSYGYGIDAMRSDGFGAHSLGILVQLDLTPAREAFFKVEPPGRWRGLQRLLGVFGS
jgi:hypothetical protein